MRTYGYLLFIAFCTSCKQDVAVITGSLPIIEIFSASKIKIDTLKISQYKSKNLMSFYKDHNFETVWQSDDSRKNIIARLKNVTTEGLEPKDYEIAKIETLESKFSTLTDDDLVTYDCIYVSVDTNCFVQIVEKQIYSFKK